jgi:hypothetical protein
MKIEAEVDQDLKKERLATEKGIARKPCPTNSHFESGNFFLQVPSSRLIFRKQRNHLPIERRNIVRFSACHKISITYDFLVHPLRTCIEKVGF